METETSKSRGVREARRQAALAKAIVEQHTHPLQRQIGKVSGFAARHPWLALVAAALIALAAAVASRRPRDSR